jgi:MFS family permease
VLVAVPSLSRVLVTPAAGYLTDRVGPRLVLGIASLGLAAGSLGAALAPGFWALVGAVFASGLAAAFMESAAVAHLVRLAPPAARGRTISRGLTGFQIGMLASPVAAGGLTVAFGWRSALVMAAAVAVVAALVAVALIRDAQPSAGAVDESENTPGRPVPWRALAGVLAFGALLWGGASTLRAVALPLYGGVTLELDPATVGLVLSLLSGLRAVATFAGGQLMDRYGRLMVIGATLILNLLSTMVLMFPPHVAFLGLTAFCYAMGGFGATSPVILLADRVPARHAGRAVAALQAASGTSALLLPLAAGALMDAAGIVALALLLAPIFVLAILVGAVVARLPAARSAAA